LFPGLKREVTKAVQQNRTVENLLAKRNLHRWPISLEKTKKKDEGWEKKVRGWRASGKASQGRSAWANNLQRTRGCGSSSVPK